MLIHACSYSNVLWWNYDSKGSPVTKRSGQLNEWQQPMAINSALTEEFE